MLGIFWLLVLDRTPILLAYTIPLAEAEPYGDCLTCALDHAEAWAATQRGQPVLAPLTAPIRRLIAENPYEHWPRGRIVYETNTARFVIYADRQIFPHAGLIRSRFALPDTAQPRPDLHYRRARPIAPLLSNNTPIPLTPPR